MKKHRLLFLLIIIVLFFAGRSVINKQKTDTVQPTTAPIVTVAPTEEPDTIQAVLRFDQLGEYGRKLTFSKGTKNEYSFIGFFFPEGTYLATNLDKKAVQLTFYSTKTVVEDGVEYPESAQNDPLVLMPEKLGEFTLHSNEYVKLSDDSYNIYVFKTE